MDPRRVRKSVIGPVAQAPHLQATNTGEICKEVHADLSSKRVTAQTPSHSGY